ncbi:FUSC family protein [Thermophilibacter provencensis]|uniref:FUSC family protein n=1 Tax=Thermophilibacter provencensis TaxID=1852386 RepID=A0ABT7V4P0_9ACTN|nr:FUSC family protein [Thermophilibacter provencensis]MDM8271553.1 FUSC family protein [Thermophilibacter provencensis]
MDREQITAWADDKRTKLVRTLPTILFFIALFWVVSLAFGDTYLLVVSPYTTLFEVRFGKYNPPGQYARFFLVSALALVAARLAVANPVLCALVNLCMPFILVYMRSSQLNPRRYFPYTMLFAFLELRPENLIETFATQAAVLAVSCALLSAVLLVAGLVAHPARAARESLHANVRRLADDLDRIASGGVGPILSQELLDVRRELAELAYTAREDSSAPARTTNLLDMLATLAQRTAYLTGNLDWSAHGSELHATCLRELASLTRELDVALKDGGDQNACQRLLPRARALLSNAHIPEDRFRIFYQSYLNMVVLILRTAADPYQRVWHLTPSGRARVALFRKRPSLDSFEMRFSLRCGAVLAVSCLSNLLLPLDHLYWYVLHAFLLLQPFPDESSRRMRTRMIGTAIGCVFVHALALLNLGPAAVTVLGMVLIAPLYASTPGSVTSAFFATAYAVSMASVSIDDAYATSMRLGSLVLAILTVALVNRLVCPTSDRRLFVANMRQMVDMVARSWELVRTTLDERVDTVVSSEALLHFQMVHSRAAGFVEELGADSEKNPEIAELAQYREAAERMLFCLWALMCELEQLELLVRLREVRDDERRTFERIVDLAEASCKPERFGTNVDAAEELLFKLAEPDLRYVLQQYVDRAGELRLAIDDAQGALVERPSYVDEVRG